MCRRGCVEVVTSTLQAELGARNDLTSRSEDTALDDGAADYQGGNHSALVPRASENLTDRFEAENLNEPHQFVE